MDQRWCATAPLRALAGRQRHLGVDRQTGQSVVITVVETAGLSEAERAQLVAEAEALRELGGGSLPTLLDLELADDRLVLVRPWLPGASLAQRLSAGALPVAMTLAVGLQVATALAASHARGLCHRRLRPAAVIVAEDDATVTLVDLGSGGRTWLPVGRAQDMAEELAGLVRYVAPEVAGSVRGTPDARSDLYALGTVLFQCLTGRPPFPGPGVSDLLRQHVSSAVPDLLHPHEQVPPVLAEVVHRLLRKDPDRRYQTAAAVVDDLTGLVAALAAGEREPALVPGRTDRRAELADAAFVGRAAELATMVAALRSAREGEPATLLLEAESGGGKSRLLDELAARAQAAGVEVLRGQGVALVGQRPFAVLDALAADLAAALVHAPDRALRLHRDLGHHAAAVVQALPALAPALPAVVAEADAGPEEHGEQRRVEALFRLLAVLAEQPTLIVLDDCQWADGVTVRLLRRWADGAGPGARVLVVAAFRSEEVSPSHPLRSLPGAVPVVLGPLDEAEVHALAESMAGPVPAEALATVARLAGGSPFMVAAVLRGLVECGALVDGGAGWVAEPSALAAVQAARRSGAVLVRRLELLAAPTLALLSAGAVLGKVFDRDLAAELAGDLAGDAGDALAEATRRRIVWTEEPGPACHFFHDKLREALLDRLAPSERQRLHARAAEALLGRGGAQVAFDVAYHLDAAGLSARALPWALAAADLARQQHALDLCVDQLRLAERSVPVDDALTGARIAESLGDALTLQGAYDEAETQLAAAARLAPDGLAAATVAGKRGDVAFKRGDLTRARAHLEGALAGLGRPVPRSAVTRLLALLAELLVQLGHTVAPWRLGRRDPTGREADVLAMRLYSRLAYTHWFQSGKVPCAWAHLRGLNLAERYPPGPGLGQAWSEHAPVMTMIPAYRRGLAYARRSYAVRRDLGDLWGQGQSLNFTGVLLYAASRWTEAHDSCRQAMALLERTGDRWEAGTAGWNAALALYRLGDLSGAAALARRVHAESVAIDDRAGAGIGLATWAKAVQGCVPHHLIADELAHGTEDAHTASEVRLAAALRARADGDLAGALAHVAEARAIVRSAGLRQEYVAPVAAWQATMLRECAQAVSALDARGRRHGLRQCRTAVVRALLWALSYRNNLPHALREAGLLAALRGRRRLATALLRRSLTVAVRQQASYESLLTRLALAEVAGRGEDAARAALTGVEPVEAPEPSPATASISLADRFTTLLRVGRSLASATSVEGVREAAREATLALLRGERCHLVDLATEQHDHLDAVTVQVIARAVAGGVPVVGGEADGVRSVLAAPVSVHGRTVACLCTTHGEVDALFGDDEVQLAGFVATLAGAALEHVADSESRSRSLAQNSSDVITLVDADLVVVDQSAAVGRVFGHPAGALTGTSVLDWVHADDRAALRDTLLQLLAVPEAPLRTECRVRHRDGSWTYAETIASNLLGDHHVRALVLNTRDVTERHELEQELRQRALRDPLTGLPNRTLFHERLELALTDADAPVSVLFLDLDDFKAVNDTLGHRAGDELLVAVGHWLRSCLRPGDTLARFGGDEFAALVVGAAPAEVDLIARRILDGSSRMVVVSGAEVMLRASIGIAHAEAGGGAAADDLLARADLAMYAAKARGKHRSEVFQSAMQDALVVRSRLQADLSRAVAHRELVVHYQPIMELGSGLLTGVEALVRWNHPTRGLLAPGSFIQIAEDSGLILEVGEWVLRSSCLAVEGLAARSLRLNVNLAARQLLDPDVVHRVAVVLHETGLPAESLVLEITESAILEDSDLVISKLHELRDLGVRLALDDFGTGYSSLTHLRRFPVDYLKIDRSFVAEITTSQEDAAIVHGVVDLAHALGVQAVAEGVEDAAQLAWLSGIGCDFAQGFLWGQPAPLELLGGVAVIPAPRGPQPVPGAQPGRRNR